MPYEKLEYRIHDNSSTSYRNKDGELHRPNGPAIEFADGRKEWYFNGLRHREDGPAVEYANGYKAWYLNGKRHREDGPAVEYVNGYKAWWLNDQKMTESEWKKALNSVKEMTMAEIAKALGYKVKVVE